MVRDPVCGMEIEEYEAVGKSDYKGTTYFFCAPSCEMAFQKEPGKYVRRLSSGDDSLISNNQQKEKKQ